LQTGFIAGLFDFKFESFITRKVAAVTYGTFCILIILAVLVIEILTIPTLGEAFEYQHIGAHIAPLQTIAFAPIVGFLSIIILRLAFESGIALVAIAENTKK
jgi:hypothetical protein